MWIPMLRAWHRLAGTLSTQSQAKENILEWTMINYESIIGVPTDFYQDHFLPLVSLLLEIEPEIVLESVFPPRFWSEAKLLRETAASFIFDFLHRVYQCVEECFPLPPLVWLVLSYLVHTNLANTFVFHLAPEKRKLLFGIRRLPMYPTNNCFVMDGTFYV
jgi:hypothetical protein